MMSAQEEAVLVLAAVTRLGEPTAHEVAQELGCETSRHTLGRLVDAGRVERFRERSRSTPDAWVYCFRLATCHAPAESKAA